MNIKTIREKGLSFNAVCYIFAMVFTAASLGAFGMLQGIYIKELNIGEDF